MLDTMDDGQLDEFSSGDADSEQNKKQKINGAPCSDESQDGGMQSSSQRAEQVDNDDEEDGQNTPPRTIFDVDVDDVDYQSSKKQNSVIEKEVEEAAEEKEKSPYTEGESERVADSSDEEYKKSQQTACFHHTHLMVTGTSQEQNKITRFDNFTSVLNEQGYDIKTQGSRHEETPPSSKQGGQFTFLRN